MRIILFLLVLLLPQASFAFSNFVHELICSASYELSNDETKDFIDDLMDRSNVAGDMSFPEACIWADKVRKTTHRETYEYHYINVPREEQFDHSRDCAAHDCVTQAVERYALNLNDSNVRTTDRKEALVFLGHFVGDLHQPLHIGNAEDLGGNRISVFTSATDQTLNTKLHAIWDSTIPMKAGLRRSNAQSTIIAAIRQGNRDAWRTTDIIGWAGDSFDIAKQNAYQFPNSDPVNDGARLTGDYYDVGKPIIYEQVMKAIVRLTFLLDQAVIGNLDPDSF